MESLKSFENKEIVFYTLILKEQEQQSIQESPEIIEDFLEDKLCSLLNLPRTCEYFLRFWHTQDSKAYHCLLLNKDALKSYVSNAETYLSHPCFLCAQFLQPDSPQSQAFLVLDSYAQWTLIHYYQGEIVFLQPMKNLEAAREKLETLRQKATNFSLTLWIIPPINPTQSQAIEAFQSQFDARILSYKLEEVAPLDSFNFNPLEKTLPLGKQQIGKALKFGALGACIGIGIWLVLWILNLLENREINDLQAHIKEQNIKIQYQKQNYTESQKQILHLQEKLESLQSLHNQNAQFLKNAMPNATRLVPFFSTINPLLQQYNVKIAYLGLRDKDLVCLLLKGKNTLQILEELEKLHWGDVQSLESYQGFYWITLRIPQ